MKIFDKKIHFVLAVLDATKKDRNLINMEEFNSSIAKFSLNVLTKEMAAIGKDFLIYQIQKEQVQQSKVA